MTHKAAAYTIGVIGTGSMGSALVRGLLAGSPAQTVFQVFDKDPEQARALASFDESRITFVSELADLVAACDPVIISVKPQDMDPLLRSVAEYLIPGKMVISTAAGVTLERLRNGAGMSPKLYRIMPNLAVALGEGVVALAPEDGTDKAALEGVRSLLSCLGSVEILREEYFDAVTAVAGSGPAFLAVVLEALEDGAVRSGLARSVARVFVRQTALGTARMLMDMPGSAAELKDKVTSPGGTTIAGLGILEDRGVRGALLRAVEAATERGSKL
ncbi:MAG: pyrroline-5-carboxylate reductase [Thermoleophilia bacterium]